MKICKRYALLVGLAWCLGACGGSDNGGTEPEPIPTPDPTPEVSDFVCGADISWITELEKKGHKWYNAAGQERECTALMKELGLDAVRLRVWVDPSEHDDWCNKEDLLVKAKRAQALGMDIMVNFHYSDWWADPAKQNIPAAWKSHDYATMKSDVAAHTKEVLNLLKQHGITPKWVQVGNETSNGFLWEVGKADANPKQYAGLFAAGYEAVKAVFPDAVVIVHLDNGFDAELYKWNLDVLKQNGAKFDMIGMSLYPYWATLYNHEPTAEKTITDCIANIKTVAARYDCDVMIVETGMECADDQGNLASAAVLAEGKKQLARILQEAKENTNGRCKGLFYWEPECKPSQYRLGAFTEDGRPTVIMEAFQD